ncbi:MAG: glycosyl hydrolase family 28-related protein [Planctomycetia bacterium]|nr:glycosyl hydrolase family 28-related protein [Planctomycetia bacterium]
MANLSRRNWMATLALAGVSSHGGRNSGAIPAAGMPLGQPLVSHFARNVLEFGAKGDAKTDNTAAFQKALDAVHSAGGGIVHVPTGRYLFKGHLTMSAYTTLEGVFRAPPALFPNASSYGPLSIGGSLLLVTEGRGRANGPPFIEVNGDNCTIRGLGIYYPEQPPNAPEPTPYPWAIQAAPTNATTDDFAMIDVALVNPYQGINLTGAARHYVARVYGQPMKTGIFVDNCHDVGRIEDIHFFPFWSYPNDKGNVLMNRWKQKNGTAFAFGRSDWQYVFNTFCYGYHIGYHFIMTAEGGSSGNFLGLGADGAFLGLVVDGADPNGQPLQFTNCNFDGYDYGYPNGANAQGFVIGPKNHSTVTMDNCSFWGPSKRCGTIQGTGPVSLVGCTFTGWDASNHGEPAILCDGPSTTIIGCQLQDINGNAGRKKAVGITKRCATAVITGNTIQGDAFVVDRSGLLPKSKFQIHSNVATGSQ